MSVDLPIPRVATGEAATRIGPLSKIAPKPVKFVLNWGRRYSLWVFNFGLACCAIEFIATSMSRHDFIRLGVIPFAPGPRQADLMVVSGTVSDKMAPAIKRLYEQMPEPKYVISFGACSNCGGPYWDSYCVTKGVDQIIPVDVYVPGCPPRPEALLHGIIRLQDKIAAESLGDRYAAGSAEPVSPPPKRPPMSATVLRRPLVLPPPIPELLEEADERTTPLRPADLATGIAGAAGAADDPTRTLPLVDDPGGTAAPPADGPADGPAEDPGALPEQPTDELMIVGDRPTDEIPVVSDLPTEHAESATQELHIVPDPTLDDLSIIPGFDRPAEDGLDEDGLDEDGLDEDGLDEDGPDDIGPVEGRRRR